MAGDLDQLASALSTSILARLYASGKAKKIKSQELEAGAATLQREATNE